MVLILVVDKSAGVAMVPVYLFGRGCFDTPEILSGDLPNRPESYLETFDAVDCCTVVRSLESVKFSMGCIWHKKYEEFVRLWFRLSGSQGRHPTPKQQQHHLLPQFQQQVLAALATPFFHEWISVCLSRLVEGRGACGRYPVWSTPPSFQTRINVSSRRCVSGGCGLSRRCCGI